jgi:phosphate transport system substrate-binding protein
LPHQATTPMTAGPARQALPKRRIAVVIGLGLVLTGCGSDYPLGEAQRQAAENNSSNLSGTVTGGGSSAQNSAMNAWIGGFATMHPQVQVQYASVGSGAGRAGLLAGATNFAGSDAYLKESEVARSKERCGPEGAINIPTYISPISVAFNLPGIEELNFDAATVAMIFGGKITSWQDPAIKALNPGISIPDVPMTAVARSDDSGTTENFTDYLHAAAPENWTHDPSGSWPGGLGSEQAQGNSGVVTTVARTVGAVTYADDSLVDKTLGKGKLRVGDSFVAVSGESAAIAVTASHRVPGRGGNDIALELDRSTTKAGAYPLVLVSYFIVCSGYTDPNTVDLVKAFGHYIVSDEGQKVAADSAKSAPMPKELAAEAAKAIDSIALRP